MRPGLVLTQLAERQQQAGQLHGRELGEGIGLIFGGVGRDLEVRAVAAVLEPRVMARRDVPCAEAVGEAPQRAELDEVVAGDARVRRAAPPVVVDEAVDDVLAGTSLRSRARSAGSRGAPRWRGRRRNPGRRSNSGHGPAASGRVHFHRHADDVVARSRAAAPRRPPSPLPPLIAATTRSHHDREQDNPQPPLTQAPCRVSGGTSRCARSAEPLAFRRLRSASTSVPSTCRASRTRITGTIGAPVYVRGFLRTYSRFLGLDPEEAVARFNATLARPRPAGAAARAARRDHPHRRGAPRGVPAARRRGSGSWWRRP